MIDLKKKNSSICKQSIECMKNVSQIVSEAKEERKKVMFAGKISASLGNRKIEKTIFLSFFRRTYTNTTSTLFFAHFFFFNKCYLL